MGQGKTYLSKFNLGSYRGAETVNVVFNYTPDSSLEDLSIVDSNKVLLSRNEPFGFNYTISTIEETDTNIFLNRNLSGLCRSLTNLQHTDLIDKTKVNYHYVTNMHTTFANCYSLNAQPISGKYVNSMYGTYYNDSNLIDEVYINANVNNMIGTFYRCNNITGSPKVNKNVRMTISSYYQCDNLTGRPAPNVYSISMARMYYNCDNLVGAPSNCNNALVTAYAYYRCPNIYGTFYWDVEDTDQASAVNARYMFYGRDTSKKLNIYVRYNKCILNALVNYPSGYGAIYGTPLTWTQYFDSNGYPYYVNTVYNTNIYCHYNRIYLSSFYLNELTSTGDYSLKGTRYVNENSTLGIYYNYCYRNFGINVYMPRWSGFVSTPPATYNRKVSINGYYDISLYYVNNFIQSFDNSVSINSNSANVYYDGRNYRIVATFNKINFYFQDIYMHINKFNLQELYFKDAAHYNVFLVYKPSISINDNLLSDLQLINFTYQTDYSRIDGVFDNNSIIFPLESENTINMDSCFYRQAKSGYSHYEMMNIINSSLSSNIVGIIPEATSANEYYTASSVIGVIDNYINFNTLLNNGGNNSKIIAISTDNVINMNYTYYNSYIYQNAACGNNVRNFIGVYSNANIDDQIVLGPNVINMSSAYYNAVSNSNKTLCGSLVQNMDRAYYQYRCRNVDERYSDDGNEITINVGPNVKSAVFAFSHTNINISNIKFSPKMVNASGMFYSCWDKQGQKPLPLIQAPSSLQYIDNCFSSVYNINNINNIIICGDLATTNNCFAHLSLIKYPLNLNNYNITTNASYMYAYCTNLLDIGQVSNINGYMTGMFTSCRRLDWDNIANSNNIIFNSAYLNSIFYDTYCYNFGLDINFIFNRTVSPYITDFISNIRVANLRFIFNTNYIGYPVRAILTNSIVTNLWFNKLLSDAIYTPMFINVSGTYRGPGDSYNSNVTLFYDISIDHLGSNSALVFNHTLNNIRQAGSLFQNCRVNHFDNVYFSSLIIQTSFMNFDGSSNINCYNTVVFESLNNYYADNAILFGRNTKDIKNILFQHCGAYDSIGQVRQLRYLRDRYIEFFYRSDLFGEISQNLIIDYTRYDGDGDLRADNSVIIDFTGYTNGLKVGNLSMPSPITREYVFDVIGNKDNLPFLATVRLNLNTSYEYASNKMQFYYNSSFVNMPYRLNLNSYIRYNIGYYPNGREYYYLGRLFSMFTIFNSIQDNYLENIIINIGCDEGCPEYIFEVHKNLPSCALPNFQNLSIYIPQKTGSTNKIKFSNRAITTPEYLNTVCLYDTGSGAALQYLPSHIYNIFDNSSVQNIEWFNLNTYYIYNNTSPIWTVDNQFNIIENTCSSISIFNNIKKWYIHTTLNTYYSYAMEVTPDMVMKAVFKRLNMDNSQAQFNMSHITFFYNDFSSFQTQNCFNFISQYNLIYFKYWFPTLSFNTSALNTFNGRLFLNTTTSARIYSNYFSNKTTNLFNQWKLINLYGLYGINLHNVTIDFTNEIQYATINTVSNNNDMVISGPMGIFYLYDNYSSYANGKMFGDLTWDSKSNVTIRSGSFDIIYYNYYNIINNVRIYFTISKRVLY